LRSPSRLLEVIGVVIPLLVAFSFARVIHLARVDLIRALEIRNDRVSSAIRAALDAGFHRPMFVFLRRQVTDRPLLGRLWRNRARAAQTTAIEAPGDATIIEAARFPTCTALAREIVDARLADHDVALLLPPTTPALSLDK